MRIFAFSTAFLIGGAMACGSAPPAQVFVYHDLRCGPSPSGEPSCQEVGDGLSHRMCNSDSECPSDAPYCRTLGLYKGGDFNCNGSVRICRPADRDDCT